MTQERQCARLRGALATPRTPLRRVRLCRSRRDPSARTRTPHLTTGPTPCVPQAIPDCAPWYNHGNRPGDAAWTGAFPLVAAAVADYYEDDAIVAATYPSLVSFVEYEIAEALDDPTKLYTHST